MPKYTKKITLELTDRVYSELKSDLIIKKMSGNLYGTQDEMFMKLMKALRDNEPELALAYKDEK